jgi:hypothetical protein
MAAKPKKNTGKYPGPGYNETGPGVPRKVLKRPTGELPKRSSDLAKFIAGVKSNNLTPAQARIAAGLYRDMVKASNAKGLDATGVILGNAIKKTQPIKSVKKK